MNIQKTNTRSFCFDCGRYKSELDDKRFYEISDCETNIVLCHNCLMKFKRQIMNVLSDETKSEINEEHVLDLYNKQKQLNNILKDRDKEISSFFYKNKISFVYLPNNEAYVEEYDYKFQCPENTNKNVRNELHIEEETLSGKKYIYVICSAIDYFDEPVEVGSYSILLDDFLRDDWEEFFSNLFKPQREKQKLEMQKKKKEQDEQEYQEYLKLKEKFEGK